MASSIVSFIQNYYTGGFPSSGNFYWGPKTGMHLAKIAYIDQIASGLNNALAIYGGNNYSYLMPSLQIYASTANLRSAWAIISKESQLTTLPGSKTTATFVFDASSFESAIRSAVTGAFREWYRTVVSTNLYLDDAAKAGIKRELERLLAAPIDFESAMEKMENPETYSPEYELHLPDNAIGKIKSIDAEFQGDGSTQVFSPTVKIDGEEYRAWLVPGRGFSGSARVIVDGSPLVYGDDFIIDDGVIKLREPLPTGSIMKFSGIYVESLLQTEINKFAPFYSGKSVGLPPSVRDPENLTFYSETGISSATWDAVTKELENRGVTFSDLDADQQRRLINEVSAFQASYDLLAFTAYMKTEIDLPRLFESARIPPIRFVGLKWGGWSHLQDESAPELWRTLTGTKSPTDLVEDFSAATGIYRQGLGVTVDSVVRGPRDKWPSPTKLDYYMETMLSMLDEKTLYMSQEFDRLDFSPDIIPSYISTCRIYAADEMTRFIVEAVTFGRYSSEESFMEALKEKVDDLVEYLITRCRWAHSQFRVQSELVDSIVGSLIPAFRPSSLLHKPSTEEVQTKMLERWDSEVKPTLREDLIQALSGANTQSLPDIKSVITQAIQIVATSAGPIDMFNYGQSAGRLEYYSSGDMAIGSFDNPGNPLYWLGRMLGATRVTYQGSTSYDLVKWLDRASRITDRGSRESSEAYVDDLLKYVEELVHDIIPIMKTRPMDDVWFTMYGFQEAANRFVDVLALAVKQTIFLTGDVPITIPSFKTDATMPMEKFAARVLDSLIPGWRPEEETLDALEVASQGAGPLAMQELVLRASQSTTYPSAYVDELERAVNAIKLVIHRDPYAMQLVWQIENARTATELANVPIWASELERVLEENPMFREQIELRLAKPEIATLIPQPEESPFQVDTKWRSAVMATIADYSAPDAQYRWIPRNTAEEQEFAEHGWNAILAWLGPELAKEFHSSQDEVTLLLNYWRKSFENIIDQKIYEVRTSRDSFWDPTGTLHFETPEQAHLSFGRPVFVKGDSIREQELPLIARYVVPDLLKLGRDLCTLFLPKDYGPLPPDGRSAYISVEEAKGMVDLVVETAARNAVAQINPAYPLSERLRIAEEIREQLRINAEGDKAYVEQMINLNPSIEEFELWIDGLREKLEQGANSLVARWIAEPASKLELYSRPITTTSGFDYSDPAIPEPFKIQVVGPDVIEQELVKIKETWLKTLESSVVTGIPGQEYANILNTVDWTSVIPVLRAGIEYGGGKIAGFDSYKVYVQMPDGTTKEFQREAVEADLLPAHKLRLESLYEEAKKEFAQLPELDALLRVLLYNIPISNRLNESGELADIYGFGSNKSGGFVWTCYRWLTKHFEDYFLAKTRGETPVIKFQINFADPKQKAQRLAEMRSALVAPNGIIRKAQDAINDAFGYEKAKEFYVEAMNEFTALWNAETYGIGELTDDEWTEFSIRLLDAFNQRIKPLISRYSLVDTKLNFTLESELISSDDYSTYPLHTRIAWIREAIENPNAPGAASVLEQAPPILERARVGDIGRINALLNAFGSEFQKLMAGVYYDPDFIASKAIKEFSWEYLERLYTEVIVPVERTIKYEYSFMTREGETKTETISGRDVLLTVANQHYYDILKFMWENKLCYPTSRSQAEQVLDGFARAIQMSYTNPSLVVFAKMWHGIKEAVLDLAPLSDISKLTGGAINPPSVAQIPFVFKVLTVTEEANRVLDNIYIDAWGRAYTPEEAINMANYDWMIQMLRHARNGDAAALDRFDKQFELIWRPFMEQESRNRTRGLLYFMTVPKTEFSMKDSPAPNYFTEMGRKLQQMREEFLNPQNLYFIDPKWKSADPEDRPIEQRIFLDRDGGYAWGLDSSLDITVKARVEMSDGRFHDVEFMVDPANNNDIYIDSYAKMVAMLKEGVMSIALPVRVEIIEKTEPRTSGEGAAGGGGGTW